MLSVYSVLSLETQIFGARACAPIAYIMFHHRYLNSVVSFSYSTFLTFLQYSTGGALSCIGLLLECDLLQGRAQQRPPQRTNTVEILSKKGIFQLHVIYSP